MKKVFTSRELLEIDEILNKYGSDKDTTVTASELYLLTKLYEDYQQLVRRIDKTEADNDKYINVIKNMKENFTEHLNALEAENEKLKAENEELKEQVIDGLNKERRSLHNTINILRADNSNQSHEIHKLKEENKKLCEKAAELRTIKKSFEVLRALYLGDYENDEPF